MSMEYNKVKEDDPAVVELATQLGVTPKAVAGMMNAERYRKAYNRMKQAEAKRIREFFKQHPELLPKEGGE